MLPHLAAFGVVILIFSCNICIQFLLGKDIYFFYAGLFPNTERYQGARIIAFISSIFFALVGGYLVYSQY